MIGTILAMLGSAPALIGDAAAAYQAIAAFIATPEGQDLEKQLAALFVHAAQPSAGLSRSVVVTPNPANYAGAGGKSMYDFPTEGPSS